MPSGTRAITRPRSPSQSFASYRDSGLGIFALLLAFRIVNALTLRTFFQPDEFFQSLEPAWQLAFGHASNAWITWVNTPLPFCKHTSSVHFAFSSALELRLMIVAGVENPIEVIAASRNICGCLSGGGKTIRPRHLEPAI